MTVNFNEILTTEQKQLVLTNKIQQLAAEGYQLEINKTVLAQGPDADAQVSQANLHIELIKKAIVAYQTELETLN